MPRKASPYWLLAYRFAKHIMCLEDVEAVMPRYRREASLVVNKLACGDKTENAELAWNTLLALKRGMFGFDQALNSIWAATWGDPPYYLQYKSYCETPPPAWNKAEVELWEKTTGKVAYPGGCDIMASAPSVPPTNIPQDNSYAF